MFKCRQNPSAPVTKRVVQKFENTGTVIDNRKGIVSTKRTARSGKNIVYINETIM
jgi:hypothetical protein